MTKRELTAKYLVDVVGYTKDDVSYVPLKELKEYGGYDEEECQEYIKTIN